VHYRALHVLVRDRSTTGRLIEAVAAVMRRPYRMAISGDLHRHNVCRICSAVTADQRNASRVLPRIRQRGPSMEKSETAEVLGRAHAALLTDLTKLKETLQPGSGASLLEVCAQLAATHKHVTDHFGFEEQNGWIDVVRRQESRWEHAIGQLVQEHRQLVKSLETLIEEADAAQNLNLVFCEKVLRWIERVIDHETRENELFEDAFVTDLGAGD
jgi:hemerythrin-like domain-containing protein